MSLFVFCNRRAQQAQAAVLGYISFWLLSLILDSNHYPEIFVIPKFDSQYSKPGSSTRTSSG
ncbi:hypothetical protein [Paenibacillus sp. MER TA 81-3]|uniref:hypothetical protein n=1 Tax=Paenibacillus sp. MER TA 81-3 TaxID=2939573 RepID=UPI0034D974EA